jgi:hypothetical protein
VAEELTELRKGKGWTMVIANAGPERDLAEEDASLSPTVVTDGEGVP